MNNPFEINKVKEKNSDEHGRVETMIEVMERYLRLLDFKKEDLIDKVILDIGSGKNTKFAKALRENGISENVKSVDRNIVREIDSPDQSLVTAEAQNLPFNDNTFDYVVSVHALPHVAHTGKIEKEINMGEYKKRAKIIITQAIQECLRVVKERGEIRLGGIPEEEILKKHVVEALQEGVINIGEILVDASLGEGKQRLYVIRKY